MQAISPWDDVAFSIGTSELDPFIYSLPALLAHSVVGQERCFESRSIISDLPRSTDILGGNRHVAKVTSPEVSGPQSG
jgi:hypothetical protein